MSFLRFIVVSLMAAARRWPVGLPQKGGAALLVSILAVGVPVAVVQAQSVQAQASGTVVRVTPDKGKIAIRHSAISKLDLPAMTLVYHLDPALLAGVQNGDKVDFTAERRNGQYWVVKLEKQ
ncbi:copper-binding protein [Castellaniella sp.]|uniref:copper-binding protein n=1 Tax=Castellaniella sp. TaxID=1955812 RepID=UPI003C74107F